MRRCPLCGVETPLRRCPGDLHATLRIARCRDAVITEGSVIDGRYRLGPTLDTGGSGSVHGGEDLLTGASIAVKVMSVGRGDKGTRARIRFVREAAITRTLTSQHTVAMTDCGETPRGDLFAVMERLRGESLHDRLARFRRRDRALPAAEVVKIGVSVLSALKEAHDLELVHRDVTPGNIVFHHVDGDEIVKLIDFGMVRIGGSVLTQRGRTVGTPAYMSPEQVRAEEVDSRSDLYSLGCVLYQCIARRPPFPIMNNPMHVMLAHAKHPVTPLEHLEPSVEPAIAAIIHIALEKRPEARFQSAEAMANALRGLRLTTGAKRRAGSLSRPRTRRPNSDPPSVSLEDVMSGLQGPVAGMNSDEHLRNAEAAFQRLKHGSGIHNEITQAYDD